MSRNASLLVELAQRRLPESVGSKARNLRRLCDYGFRIPPTQVCTWEAHARYLNNDLTLIDQLLHELAVRLDPECAYAVRSSADVEDSLAHTFAGQFKSVLEVRGVSGLLQAMWSIWSSTHSPSLRAYMERFLPGRGAPRMAVILQNMVPPVISGVAFSKNPLTGLDEIIVEAVPGPGTTLVQEGATPGRWVHKWGEWIARPDIPSVDIALISDVVAQCKAIARKHRRPVDLEWVFDGSEIHWVQMREITSLQNLPLYSNRITREMLPGLIKPLVWSINIPMVNGAWVRLLTEVIGPNQIDPLQLARSFYYRAYFNMGLFGDLLELLGLPRETLELMLGVTEAGSEKPRFRPSGRTYRLMPRMFAFAVDKLMLDRRIDAFLPRMQAFYRATPIERVGQLSDAELLGEIDRLYTATQETARYNIVVPLLMQIYNRLLRSQLSRRGLDYGRLDLTAGLTGWKELDPAAQIDDLRRAAATLTPAQRASLSVDGDWAGTDDEDLVRLRRALDDFLERFGHLSDSGNDFSSVPWREQPDLVSRLVLADIVPTADHEPKLRFSELPLSPLQRGLLGPLYRRACRYRLYREQVSSLYTYGYGLFRVFFLEIGERLVRRQGLRTRDDVFLLTIDELRSALCREQDGLSGFADLAVSRRQEMEAARDISPPETLYGDKPVPINNAPGRVLHGTPTSRGYYVGRACAVRGLGDFGKLQPGDVLVIPFSDVSWTPLFALAGAVVAESGGMLSHSSIVAREYGLPAVVSVFEACQRLDGLQVTVDGYRGDVWLPDKPDPAEDPGKEE